MVVLVFVVFGVDIVVEYLVVVEDIVVGGDWFDVLVFGDWLVFVVGDVVGYGVEVVVVML